MTNGQKNKIATTFIVKIYCCNKIEKSLYFWPSSILWLKNSVQIYNKSKNTLLITRHMIPHPFDLSKIWRNVMTLVKDSFIRHSIFQPSYFKSLIISGKSILVSYVDFSYTMPPMNVNSLQVTNIVWQKYLICTYRIFLASHYIQEHSQWLSSLLENKNIRYFGRRYDKYQVGM